MPPTSDVRPGRCSSTAGASYCLAPGLRLVTRRMLTGPENDRQPVEVANIIIPADNTALDYTINLE